MSFRSTFRLPSNLTLLVMLSSMVAAMPFMASNGLEVLPPSIATAAVCWPGCSRASHLCAMSMSAWFSTGSTQSAYSTSFDAASSAL